MTGRKGLNASGNQDGNQTLWEKRALWSGILWAVS